MYNWLAIELYGSQVCLWIDGEERVGEMEWLEWEYVYGIIVTRAWVNRVRSFYRCRQRQTPIAEGPAGEKRPANIIFSSFPLLIYGEFLFSIVFWMIGGNFRTIVQLPSSTLCWERARWVFSPGRSQKISHPGAHGGRALFALSPIRPPRHRPKYPKWTAQYSMLIIN
jgi:hypothetical protein